MKRSDGSDYGLWELAVLALLRERPMHPYEILRLLKQRHKDDVLVLKRGSLYHAIRRLAAAKLITEVSTSREGLRPERTTYSLTPTGETALLDWLSQRIALPVHERSNFMGSISFLFHLDPRDVVEGLEKRLECLHAEMNRLDQSIADTAPRIGRIHILESEYARTMRAAESKWIREILADLRNGSLSWNLKAIMRAVRAAPNPSTKRRASRSAKSGG